MKYALFSLFLVFTIAQPTSNFPVCDRYSVVRNAIPKLTLERGLDAPNHNSLVAKALHNRYTFYGHEFGKCYSVFVSPTNIFNSLGFLTLFFIFYYVLNISKRNSPVLLLFLASPLFHIATTDQVLIVVIYKLTAVVGMYYLFLTNHKRTSFPNEK